MSTTITRERTVDLGWGCTEVRPEAIAQDQDTAAQLFADYLAADTQAGRLSITRELTARGLLGQS